MNTRDNLNIMIQLGQRRTHAAGMIIHTERELKVGALSQSVAADRIGYFRNLLDNADFRIERLTR